MATRPIPTFEGDLFKRGGNGYEEARLAAVWNGRKPKRFPDMILLAESEQDVVNAVRMAADRGFKIGIRSGGHSWVGNGVRDGGLLIDLSRMQELTIDVDAQTAAVSPAFKGRELNERLGENGLYFPGGHCPSVGLGGFLLGAGFGWNCIDRGVGATSVRAIDVVTADGELIRADDSNNSDYMWAARGSGPGFFGVITRFHLNVYPLPHLARSFTAYKAEDAKEVLDWWLPQLPDLHDRFNTSVFAHRSHAPGSEDKLMFITQTSFGTTEEESLELMKPFESKPLLEKAVMAPPPARASFGDAYDFMDGIYPEGLRYFADSNWVDHTQEGLSATLQGIFESLPTRWSHVLLGPWKPREHRNHAFSQQSFLSIHVYGVSDKEEDDEAMFEWTRATMDLLKPYEVAGGKINDADLMLRDHLVLSEENTTRLEELRAKYDPRGIFHSYLRSDS
jgi:hypothetical protein